MPGTPQTDESQQPRQEAPASPADADLPAEGTPPAPAGTQEAGQAGPHDPAPVPPWEDRSGPSASGGAGFSGRNWLWFAAGMLFAIFAVIAAVLLTMNKEPEQRNEAVRYAAWGMIAGLVVELVVVYAISGTDGVLNLFGLSGQSSSSSASLF